MEFVDNIKKTAKKLRGVIRESVTGDPNQSIRDTIEARVTGDRELLQRRRLIREKEKKEKAARAAAAAAKREAQYKAKMESLARKQDKRHAELVESLSPDTIKNTEKHAKLSTADAEDLHVVDTDKILEETTKCHRAFPNVEKYKGNYLRTCDIEGYIDKNNNQQPCTEDMSRFASQCMEGLRPRHRAAVVRGGKRKTKRRKTRRRRRKTHRRRHKTHRRRHKTHRRRSRQHRRTRHKKTKRR